ncbi:winged helix-turn-helix domain-containing protein [Nocardia wallacei]|uniref:winged helix-turn-helix domain-containing protein n=1 Tax=Nocardia wallacei TaxID=480035 RepID=UPI00245786A9|nr:winged helix-turn-helix domain-containing protein [Nocardia wallacei]
MSYRHGYGKNQRKILECLRDETPRTSAEVAAATGLSKAVVTNTIRALGGHKLVAETGQRGGYNARKWAITPADSDTSGRDTDTGENR